MSFDPTQFLDTQYDEANDTHLIPIPESEPHAIIEKVSFKDGTIGKGERIGEPYVMAMVQWNIDDEAIKATLERSKVVITQSIMLDFKEGTLGVAGVNPALDFGKGKNVQLGQLREAIQLNTPGQPFSFAMFPGRAAKLRIKHKPDDRPGNQGQVLANVVGVVKI